MPEFFHFYATANNDKSFTQDILNLRNIANHDPGVCPVRLHIAISTAKPKRWLDARFEKLATRIFSGSRSVRLESLVFKHNTGRDFSSFATAYRQVSPAPQDYLFFQNRSGYGPQRDNWYGAYVDQYSRQPDVAICGTTLNFLDHPKRSQCRNMPHVQTYAFLSQHVHLAQFQKAFPGEREQERLNLILNGEIGLSQTLLHQGKKLTCLEWPDLFVDLQVAAAHIAPLNDPILKASTANPFMHRLWVELNRQSIPQWLARRAKQKSYNLLDYCFRLG